MGILRFSICWVFMAFECDANLTLPWGALSVVTFSSDDESSSLLSDSELSEEDESSLELGEKQASLRYQDQHDISFVPVTRAIGQITQASVAIKQ
jgi:hypothetical protein